MTSPRAYSIYVGHIRDAIGRALQFTAGLSYDEFIVDEKAVYATERALGIVDTAARRIPDDIRKLDSTIPWQTLTHIRDDVIPAYDAVDLPALWNLSRSGVQEMLPRLERLQRFLEQREDDEWERAQQQDAGGRQDA